MDYQGVRYVVATGRVVAAITASIPGTADDLCSAGEAFLSVSAAHDVRQHPDRWIVQTGALVALPEITLTPNVLTFAADGVDSCTITASGLSGDVDVRVEPGETVHLTIADPVVILTADVATAFVVTAVGPDVWSEVLTVRAV